jgi:hypothetical protein
VHSAVEEEEGEEVHQKWTRRDGVITSFCAASGEHQIVLSDAARTTHWRRLCHFQFRDWSSLPLTRAAVVRKRLVTTLLMVFNRLIKETVGKFGVEPTAHGHGASSGIFVDIFLNYAPHTHSHYDVC